MPISSVVQSSSFVGLYVYEYTSCSALQGHCAVCIFSWTLFIICLCLVTHRASTHIGNRYKSTECTTLTSIFLILLFGSPMFVIVLIILILSSSFLVNVLIYFPILPRLFSVVSRYLISVTGLMVTSPKFESCFKSSRLPSVFFDHYFIVVFAGTNCTLFASSSSLCFTEPRKPCVPVFA